MVERDISRGDVTSVLLDGERIEDYPDDYPFPSGLFLGHVEGRPLHVVAALNPEGACVSVVTAYEPDTTRFEDNFKTRKTR